MLNRHIRTSRLRTAVRRCQLLLGPQLRHDYGTSNDYTLGQITHAMERAKLPQDDLKLACAAFMTEATFKAAMPSPSTGYASSRNTLERYAAARSPSGSFEPAAENSYAVSGATNSCQPL